MTDFISGDFEWDQAKNQANIANHGISFEQASRIFQGTVFTRFDDDHSGDESREVSIGLIDGISTLVVVHTDRNDRIRLISARPATRRERKRYERELRKANDRR